MDHIDRKIIDILQRDARAPLKQIADQVFLSSPAVSARIARLEKDGCLTGYQAQVDPQGVHQSGHGPPAQAGVLPLYPGLPPGGGMLLRHRRLQHAH